MSVTSRGKNKAALYPFEPSNQTLEMGDVMDYVQMGASGNRYYMYNSLLTITEVPVDKTWMRKYGPILSKTFDEIQYYKDQSVPIPAKRSKDEKYIYPTPVTAASVLKKKMKDLKEFLFESDSDEDCPILPPPKKKQKDAPKSNYPFKYAEDNEMF